jgi:hypothetical protein
MLLFDACGTNREDRGGSCDECEGVRDCQCHPAVHCIVVTEEVRGWERKPKTLEEGSDDLRMHKTFSRMSRAKGAKLG